MDIGVWCNGSTCPFGGYSTGSNPVTPTRSLGMTKNNLTENELIDSFKTFGSFESVGKHFGVTGKAVVKWLKKFGLPTKKKELKKYIEISKTTNA